MPSEPRDPAAELEEIDAVFRALAHPSRRQAILVLHFRGGVVNAGEIASRFSCSWPTMSRHLGVLREAGIVRVTKRSRERFYELDRDRLKDVVGGWLEWLDRPAGGEPAA